MEFLNYGSDNCNVAFNANTIVKQIECDAALTDLGNGWKQLSVTNWQITDITETGRIHIFFASPFLLSQIGETGVIILDNLVVNSIA